MNYNKYILYENRSQINKQTLNMCKILTTNINNFDLEVADVFDSV